MVEGTEPDYAAEYVALSRKVIDFFLMEWSRSHGQPSAVPAQPNAESDDQLDIVDFEDASPEELKDAVKGRFSDVEFEGEEKIS